MKIPPRLLAVSLVANAALLAAFALQPALIPPSLRDFFAPGSNPTTSSTPSPVAAQNTKTKLWTTFHSDNLATLVARLRAAGFPDRAIRVMVQAEIGARYDARLEELSRSELTAPFWKTRASTGMNARNLAEFARLSAERAKLTHDILGQLATGDSNDGDSARRRQFGSLPLAKIDQLERINQDYIDLNREVMMARNGMFLSEDREKLALLEREKRADLAALLTPEELADYGMRNSVVTARLRDTFGVFHATDDEFRTIYQIEQAHSDSGGIANSGIGMTTDERAALEDQRAEAQAAMEIELKAALGDQRYAEFTRAGSRDYQLMIRLAERENLPVDAANQAFEARSRLSQESNRIADDESLSYDQKRAAFAALAQETRARYVAALGPVAGAAYLKSAERLISEVEKGGRLNFTNGGYSFRGLGAPPGGGPRGVSGNVTSTGNGVGIVIDDNAPQAPAPVPTPAR